MLLSVYYLQMPVGGPDLPADGDITETERDSRLSQSRTQINNYRIELKNDLMVILGNSQATIDEKNNALATLQFIETIAEQEVSLELDIVELGYLDALVHALDDSVSVTVVTVTQTNEQMVELIKVAKQMFGSHYVVSVNFLQPL